MRAIPIALMLLLAGPVAHGNELQGLYDERDSEVKSVDEIKPQTIVDFTDVKYEDSGTEVPPLFRDEDLDNVSDRQSIDDSMQTLKAKLLEANKELLILEEDLLFPSSTQANVYFSMDLEPFFELDSVTLKIDDKRIAHHLYTPREVSALKRGAVQRLYMGNLEAGEHELVAVITGFGPEGRDYRRAVSTTFKKDNATKYIELKISPDKELKRPRFSFKDWD